MVEAGQGDEGDVIVVESAGQRKRKKKEKWEKKRKKQIVRKLTNGATYWSCGLNSEGVKFFSLTAHKERKLD